MNDGLICPECKQGKCQNCTIALLNVETDTWTTCNCLHEGKQ